MKVYVYPADTYGCGYYRMVWPALALADDPNLDVEIVLPGEDTRLSTMMKGKEIYSVNTPEDAEVIVIQRPGLPVLAAAIPFIIAKGIAVVVDVDDDLMHIDPKNPAWLAMHPNQEFKREQYTKMYEQSQEWDKVQQLRNGRAVVSPYSWAAVGNACRDATAVTVSTEPLKRVYRANATVLHNRIPADFLHVPRVDNDVIGWAGSTHSHPGDLAVMGSSIRKLMNEGSRFMIVGNGDGADKELGLPIPVPSSGPIDFDKWISGVAQIGIGVAPLAPSRFNRSKSWLKPLEYSAAGVPWVASDQGEYVSLHNDGLGGGIIAIRDRDWYKALKALTTSETLRQDMSEHVRAVAALNTVEGHAWRWAEAWTSAFKTMHATPKNRVQV